MSRLSRILRSADWSDAALTTSVLVAVAVVAVPAGPAERQAAVVVRHECASCPNCCDKCNDRDECCCRHPGEKCKCPAPRDPASGEKR